MASHEQMREIILHACEDIRQRVKFCPPKLDGQILPRFFEGMPHYPSEIFSPTLQQYLSAPSQPANASFAKKAEATEKRELVLSYGNDLISGSSSLITFVENPDIDLLSLFENSSTDIGIYTIGRNYSRFLHNQKQNRLEVPPFFSSLQIQILFEGYVYSAIQTYTRNFMLNLCQAVDQLETSERTEENLHATVGRATGLTPDNDLVINLVSALGLRQRAGLYYTEEDKTLAGIFFETLKRYGYNGPQDFQLSLLQVCRERNIPGIKTHMQARDKVAQTLGSFYFDALAPHKQNRTKDSRIKLVPIEPKRVRAVDSVGVDTHQIIKEVTLNTGERTTSSLNHSALYREPSRAEYLARKSGLPKNAKE